MTKNPRLIDITGQRFGELTVIRQHGNYKGGGAIWLCKCDCGKISRPGASDLRAGKVKSCGHDRMEKWRASTRTHGQTGTRLYRIWKTMRSRCESPSGKKNESYGGKGVLVCDGWKDFSLFAEWAHKSGYRDDLTIERLNNDGNYEPDNCCWTSSNVQNINKGNVPLSPDGRAWCRIARKNGITVPAYSTRIFAGWPIELAATWPMFKHRPAHLK